MPYLPVISTPSPSSSFDRWGNWDSKRGGIKVVRKLRLGPGFLILRLEFIMWWWKENIHTVNHKAILKTGKAIGEQEPWFSSPEAHPAPFFGCCNTDHGVLTQVTATTCCWYAMQGRSYEASSLSCWHHPACRVEWALHHSTSGAAPGSLWLLFPSTKDMKRQMGKDTNPIPYTLPVCSLAFQLGLLLSWRLGPEY